MTKARMIVAVCVHFLGLILIMLTAPSLAAAITAGAVLALITLAILCLGAKRAEPSR